MLPLILAVILLISPVHCLAKIGDNEKYAALVIDLDTGKTLYSRHADERRYPASLTKLMTLYLTFNALKEGKLSPNQMLRISKRAGSQPQTNIGLRAGEKISVNDAITALTVRSANDAAVVLGENLEDTEFQFAILMSQTARKLGMKNTVFRNSNGLPDRRQYSSARDITILAEAIIHDFPEYYGYFSSLKYYRHFDEFITHNHILECYPGASGMKTGFINDSGFNVVTVAGNDKKYILAVVLGGANYLERDKHMVALLDKHLRQKAELQPLLPEFAEVCAKLKSAE